MHPTKYEIIIKASETKSFTRTAEYFQYSQSAISQTIKSVEKELGIALFRRTPQGIFLSEEGHRLLPYMQEIVTGYRRLTECAGEIQHLQSGTIRMGAYLSVSCHWLPSCIREFKNVYPNIKFELFEEDDVTLLNWLQNGRLDLLFISDPKRREFEYQELFEDPFMVIVPENHFAAHRTSVSLQELTDETFICIEVAYSHYLNPLFQDANITSIQYQLLDDMAVLAMVEQGLGISILPRLVANRNPYHIKLLKLEPSYSRHIGILTRKNDYLPWAVKVFMKFALDHSPSIDSFKTSSGPILP